MSTVHSDSKATYPIQTPNAPKAVGPYSQAVRAGNYLFCSGQIPLDPQTGEIIRGDVAEQTERVLENLTAVLQADGFELQHVVKTTVFMVDLSSFVQMNEVYARYFSSSFPARSTIQVAALPKGASVEIEAVAFKND